MGLIHFLLNIVALLIGIVWTVICCFTTILLHFIFPNIGSSMMHSWSRGILALAGIRVRIEGLENVPKDRAFVLASNHESAFDIFVLGALPIDFVWISKKEVGRIPFVGHAMRAIGCYFLGRDRSEKDLNTMREVENGLRKGKSVTIFPEGTRTRTGEMLPFKKGAFRTAQNAGVDVLPVGLHGTFQIAPAGKVMKKWGHKVGVCIGKPIAIAASDDLPTVMEKARDTVLTLRFRASQIAHNAK